MAERTASIAEARANLPGLVREAEGGVAVEITRRGRPVAVLVSTTTYQRLAGGRAYFGERLDDFLDRVDIAQVGLEADEFEALRDHAAGRDAPW
jgi:prevent-host-death family protein